MHVMIYGLLVFVFQYGSRRAANREITRPMFEQNLRALFPELDKLPHADTLFRLLCRIDVSHIEQAHLDLVNRLIRNKKFTRFLINNCYPIGIDGTQKIAFSTLWDEHLLQRKIGAEVDPDDSEQEQDYQYYVYVLEASLCFQNGMVIPLMSEFLEYQLGFCKLGVQATIEFIRNTLTGPWLNLHELEQRIAQPFRLRLV